MASDPSARDEYLESVATETLRLFEEVGNAARAALSGPAPGPTTSLVAMNTMTEGAAIRHLADIADDQRKSFQVLSREPAIARVVVRNDAGKREVYFIARATPQGGGHATNTYLSVLRPGVQLECTTRSRKPLRHAP